MWPKENFKEYRKLCRSVTLKFKSCCYLRTENKLGNVLKFFFVQIGLHFPGLSWPIVTKLYEITSLLFSPLHIQLSLLI